MSGISWQTVKGIRDAGADGEPEAPPPPVAPPVISNQRVRPLGSGTPEQAQRKRQLLAEQEALSKALRGSGNTPSKFQYRDN